MRAISLPHVVTSYHINQPTQARIIDPKAIRNKLARFGKRRLKFNFKDRVGFFEGFSFSVDLLFFMCSISRIMTSMDTIRSMADGSNDNMELLLLYSVYYFHIDLMNLDYVAQL